jgi:hypothetical protein
MHRSVKQQLGYQVPVIRIAMFGSGRRRWEEEVGITNADFFLNW